MTVRQILTGVLPPVLLGCLAMAVIVLPRGGHELTWPRLIAGFATLLTVSVSGGYIAGRLSVHKN